MRLIYLQRVVLFVFIFCTFFLPNCTEQQKGTFRSKPSAIGTPGQTLIIIEPELWNSAVGDSIRYNLAAAYPLLPAPEPILDLTPIKFDDMRTIKFQWKNIIFVTNLEKSSSDVVFTKETLGQEALGKVKTDSTYNYATQTDRWAKGQQVAYIFAYGEKNLAEAVSQRAKKIIEKTFIIKEEFVEKQKLIKEIIKG